MELGEQIASPSKVCKVDRYSGYDSKWAQTDIVDMILSGLGLDRESNK